MVWCAEFWRQLLPADLGGRGSVGSAPRIPGGKSTDPPSGQVGLQSLWTLWTVEIDGF